MKTRFFSRLRDGVIMLSLAAILSSRCAAEATPTTAFDPTEFHVWIVTTDVTPAEERELEYDESEFGTLRGKRSFVAQVAGFYAFSVSFEREASANGASYDDVWIDCYVVRAGTKKKVRIFTALAPQGARDAKNALFRQQAANSGFVQLRRGDVVETELRASKGAQNDRFRLLDVNFSGALLRVK